MITPGDKRRQVTSGVNKRGEEVLREETLRVIAPAALATFAAFSAFRAACFLFFRVYRAFCPFTTLSYTRRGVERLL